MFRITTVILFCLSLALSHSSNAQSFASIPSIQGSGAASPKVNQVVITEGVVTAVFKQLRGAFIQDGAGDDNPLTSDGIWAYGLTTFPVGTKVRLTGKVKEENGQTELQDIKNAVGTGTNINVQPTPVTLPINLEQYEGMLVTFTAPLTVTDNYRLNRYAELVLSVDGRLQQPTNWTDPNDSIPRGTTYEGAANRHGIKAFTNHNAMRSITVNDGSVVENPATNPFWDDNYQCRVGTTFDTLIGCIRYVKNNYTLEPTAPTSITYAKRPTAVSDLGKYNVKIASFNVLNYFNGNGGITGFPTSRGADTKREFERQEAKIVAAMQLIDADIYALMEIENDGDGRMSAIAALTGALNKVYGAATYDYVRDPSFIGTDAIKCAFIYKPAVLDTVGKASSSDNVIHHRPPIKQTFSVKANGEEFIAIVNHLKSKRCNKNSSAADAAQKDGQGCFNHTRTAQAMAIAEYAKAVVEAEHEEDIIILGDWNSYMQEDPVDAMRSKGYTALLGDDYTYVYAGKAGTLDYMFVSASMKRQLTGADVLHINSDEPVHLNYNTEYNPAGAYKADAYRASDHDPAIAAFNLSK